MVDSSGGDEGFRYYVDDSVDPGNAMLIATVIFCLLLIAALPFMVVAGQRFVKHEDCQDDATDDNEECSPVATKSSELGLTKTGSPKSELRPDLSFHTGSGISPYHRRNHDDSCSDDEDGDDGKNLDAASDDGSDQSFKTGAASVTSTLLNAILETSPHGGPIMRRNQLHIRRREVQLELEEEEDRKSEASHSVLGIISQDEVSIRDAVDASTFVQQDTMDLMNNKGNWMEKLLVIAEWDYEARRISKLGFPFVLQALAIGITEAIRVALIGKFIGTRALSAYVIVTMVVGMSNVFLKGFQDACITLCSHAVGVGNKRLAGQYIQIGTTLFTICFIPIFVCWVYATGPIFTWLGFDAATRKMGEEFALLYMFSSFLHGIDHSMHSLLDVIDKEVYSTVFVSSQEIVATLATLAVVLQPNVTNLQLLGLAYIGQKALALILNSAIIVWNGWFDKYLDGLVGNFALLVSDVKMSYIVRAMHFTLLADRSFSLLFRRT